MSAPDDDDRTASLMTPARLAQLKVRPAAASPTAWLDQMAADAGSGHVRRLVELRQQLEAQVRAREADFAPLLASCRALEDALAQLDFSLVEPKGWLARATGKGKEAAATFATRHDQAHGAGEDLADAVKALQRRVATQGTASDKLVLELGTELRALEKIMDQGARWLQDMRNQLKARQAGAPDAAGQQQIDADNARCELLVARLKVLRSVTTAMQQVLERCKAAGAARAGALAAFQQLLEQDLKPAAQKLAAVARQVEDEGAASRGVDGARSAADSLRAAVQQAAQDCSSVQALDQGAADELAGLQGTLQSAA